MSYRTAFLAWPPHLRRRVYECLGLPDGDTIVIPTRYKIQKPDFRRINIFQLLQTCSTLYIEISAILYSNNQFHLRVETSTNLQFLQNLRPQTVAHLRNLNISVNKESRHEAQPDPKQFQDHVTASGQQLDQVQPMSCRAESVFPEWHHTLNHILTHSSPYTLNLSLNCDVTDHELASQIVRPLQAEHLALATCVIAFVESEDSYLVELARTTAINTTQRRPKKESFRFLDLPPEIRHSVLEYTDLVTPLKEVYWNDRVGYFVFYSTTCDTINGSMKDKHFHYACQFRQCSQGFRCDTQAECAWEDVPDDLKENRHPGCFHNRDRADTIPDGWECHCWTSPQSIFLVCRQLRNEAETMFFQENRIVLTSSDGFCVPPASNPTRFGPSVFLERLRPSAIASLRMLEIVVPPFQNDYFPLNSRILADWSSIIKRAHFCPNKLTLRIYMTDHLGVEADQDKLPEYRKNMTDEDGTEIIETYKRILAPLSHLQRLEHFFLHLSWPWQWVIYNEMDWGEVEAYVQEKTKSLENEIGQSLFNEDQYVQYSSGEEAYVASQWLEWKRLDFYG